MILIIQRNFLRKWENDYFRLKIVFVIMKKIINGEKFFKFSFQAEKDTNFINWENFVKINL